MAIINNNVGNVKFLRNGNLFDNHEAALTGIQTEFAGITSTNADGTAILARYGSGTEVKTLVGWVYYSDSSNKSLTIFDIEGASGDVEALKQEINAKLGNGVSSGAGETVTDQLTALSGTAGASSAETSVAGAKAYAKDYTDEQIGELEYTGVTTGDGKVIVNVKETDGIVSGVTAEVGGLKLTSYSKGSDSGAVTTSDSINGAFSKVENQIDAVNDKIDNAISGLDYSDSAVAKKFVTEVSETDGVIAVERGTISSSAGTIVLNDNTDGGVDFDVNIDGQSIVKDANGVLSVASTALTQYVGDEKTIHISSADSQNNKTVSSLLTISATTPTGTNVKEQYNLVNASGETIGDTIKIYKDSSLYRAYLGHVDDTIAGDPPVVTSGTGDTALCFIYHKEDGSYELVPVNVESFLEETEFESGVTATNHIVHGVVDSNSEKDSQDTPVGFLTVGADGFKINGIKDEIDRRIGGIVDGLDATVTGETANQHVSISIEETDGKLVQSGLTITESDIASASDLDELSAKTITEVASENNSITATLSAATDGTKHLDIVTDASKIKMTGFTADASGFTAITSASTVTEAVKAIETEIIANEQTTSAALNDLNTKISCVSGDVATLSGQVQTISGKVDTIEEKYLSGVSVNGSATTVTDHVAGFNITSSSGATTATSTEAITVETDANGNITLGLATIDCGTYDIEP